MPSHSFRPVLRDLAVSAGVTANSLQQLGGWCVDQLKCKASEQALAKSNQFTSAALGHRIGGSFVAFEPWQFSAQSCIVS